MKRLNQIGKKPFKLVNNLLYENVGIPVYKINPREKRTKFLVDREVGEEDFTVRQKEENDHKLLGLIVPSQDKNEFVYLGIEEGGFVFRVSDEKATDFHKDTTTSFSLAWERFGDYITNNVMARIEGQTKIILREENDPTRFMEIVINSVKSERERSSEIKSKRTNVRNDLLRKLLEVNNYLGFFVKPNPSFKYGQSCKSTRFTTKNLYSLN